MVLMRLAGMMLPGKHAGPPAAALQAPVASGSLMKMSWPAAFSVCEKSPRISASVGMVQFRAGPGRLTSGASIE